MSYVVHECAPFSHSLKDSHEIGSKHIMRCLKGTREKGLIMTPNTEQLDLHADAYFTELFASEDKLNPFSTKSRT